MAKEENINESVKININNENAMANNESENLENMMSVMKTRNES
jgi:hypothetical protein